MNFCFHNNNSDSILTVLPGILPVFIIVLLCSGLVNAQKTDVIELINGDKVTGELKKMETSLLSLKTDNMGTIDIDWQKISKIWTDKIFEVELEDGRVFFGSFQPGERERTLLVKGVVLENLLFMEYIVKITRIKDSFWDILDGYVSLGFSYNKAGKFGELSFGGDAVYRTKIQRFELSMNSVVNTSEGNTASRKQDIYFNYRRFMEEKLFWGVITGAEANTELGLKLRATLGGGIGNNFLQTNENWLAGLIGLSANREWKVDESDPTNNLEGLINTRYQFFKHSIPEATLNTSLTIFTSFTDLGRIRSNYDLSLSWEVIINFYWDLSFYFYYDNKPQSEDASNTDYRIATSVKYTF